MKVAVVGVGGHATTAILPNLAPAGLRLVGVSARHLDRAKATADLYGVPAFDDIPRMVEQTFPDGVIVVVPPDEFAGVISTCLELRLPVFAEKPAARDANEAAQLAELADSTGVPVVVGYMKRFASGYTRAKAIAAQPEFGRLRLASFGWSVGPVAQQFTFQEWLFENPVHHFDLARYFFGELHEIQARRGPGSEYTLVVTAAADDGTPITLQATTNGSWEQRNESVELFGEGSSLRVDNVDTVTCRPPKGPEQTWQPNYTVPSAQNMTGVTMGFAGALEHFRLVVQENEPCRSDMRSAAATLSLAAAIAAEATG